MAQMWIIYDTRNPPIQVDTGGVKGVYAAQLGLPDDLEGEQLREVVMELAELLLKHAPKAQQ